MIDGLNSVLVARIIGSHATLSNTGWGMLRVEGKAY